MMKNYLLFLWLLLVGTALSAQNPPQGIYVSAGPTHANGSSVKGSNANFSFVAGVLVRLDWKTLEPFDDNFDWSLVYNQIDSANVYGKKISLAVGVGRGVPNWLLSQAQTASYSVMGNSGTIVVPWDSTFMAEWTEFVTAFGAEFDSDTTISLVYITNSSFNGFEMQLPATVSPSWTSLGYSDQKMIDSWKNAIDAFDAAFPSHYLSNDFHPILNSDTPADSIYAYARQSVGSRYGASAWWWSQKNTTVYPDQYDLLQQSANESFATVQVAKSGTNDSTLLGPGGLQGALDLAVSDGICYWEVWEIDVKNSQFHAYFDTLGCEETLTTRTNPSLSAAWELYPNPVYNTLNIKGYRTGDRIRLFDTQGRLLLQSQNAQIELSGAVPDGVYFVEIQRDGHAPLRKKILVSGR